MKKRELETWEKAECSALKAELEAYNRGKGRAERLSQAAIAEMLEVSQGSISAYMNGYNALNARVASVVAGLIGIPVSRFSHRLAEEISRMATDANLTGEELNPRHHLQLERTPQAYPIIEWKDIDERRSSPNSSRPGRFKHWLPSCETGCALSFWLEVKGRSMLSDGCPSFPEGTLILIQTEGFRLVSGKYYLARHKQGEITFKQYVLESSIGYLTPLNASFRTVELGDDWQIIGRVIDARITGL